MNRKNKILLKVNKEGKGLEVGPSHSPIAPKSDGYNVEIIDTKEKELLISDFEKIGVDTSKIEEVDYIWNGETYADLTKKESYYDWIISSHSIEHTTDLVSFLCDCESILKDDGVLSLAIPDKRFCFDHFRPLTGLGKVIDSYREGKTRHSYGTHIEFCLNFCEDNGAGSWRGADKAELELVNDYTYAVSKAESAELSREYTDAHEWCFTCHSFRLMIHDLQQLGYIKFKEVSFIETGEFEFYIVLSKSGVGTKSGRLSLLKLIDEEQKMNTSKLKRLNKLKRSVKKRLPLRR